MDAETTKVRSTSLKDQADMLSDELTNTELDLSKYENQAMRDAQRAGEVRISIKKS